MQRLAISAAGCALADKTDRSKDDFYFMNSNPDKKASFKFLDAELVVRRIRPSPKFFVAHNEALSKGIHYLYNLTRVELKTFTYAGGPKPYPSITQCWALSRNV